MSKLEFHFNVPSKLGYACRLLRKAVNSDNRLLVLGNRDTLSKLSEQLWQLSAVDFLPHGLCGAMPPDQLASTPIWLSEDVVSGPEQAVLVNLHDTVPGGFEQFERVIEIVSQDESDRAQARVRWRHYAGQGHDMIRHNVPATG